jgi:hypothetical protein
MTTQSNSEESTMRTMRPRPQNQRIFWSLIAFAIACPSGRGERPPSVCLLPDTTLVYVSVLNVPDAKARFSRTTLGGLLEDPSLQPVVAEVLRGIDDRTAPLRDSVGLTTDDLLTLPQGELTFALVPREEGQPAPVVLIDTGDHVDKARLLVRAIVQRMEEAGNVRSQREVSETAITVFESVGRSQEDVAFFQRDNTVVWSNDAAILEQVLTLWDGEGPATLATRGDFSDIMQRSRRHNPKPQITWYVNPLAVLEESSRERLEMQMAMMMIPALGLDGIKAVGGAVELDAGPYDSLWHAHLMLEKPRKGIVAMVRPKSGKMTPQGWVPADAADYWTFHWDLPATIGTLRTLYDTFRGEGALDEFIATRMSGPLGADLLVEVLPALTGRVTFLRWVEKPVLENSEAGLLAIELLPEAQSQELLREVAQKHAARLMRREFAGVVYYQLVRQQPPADPTPRRPRPAPCFGIVDDTLMITDRESLFKTVVMTQAGGVDRLAEAEDFEKMISEMNQLTAGSAPVLVRFQRPAERTEAWYQPLREQQQMEESTRPRRPRGPFRGLEQTLQNHTLPPFDALRQYFPPGGAVLVDDDAGLHYTGFTLKSQKQP